MQTFLIFWGSLFLHQFSKSQILCSMDFTHLLWVISFRINHQTRSTGFRSGEYGGKKTNSILCAYLFKIGWRRSALWNFTLSNTMYTFLPSKAFDTISKKVKKVIVFPFSAMCVINFPLSGQTQPKIVRLSLFRWGWLIFGCFPRFDQL